MRWRGGKALAATVVVCATVVAASTAGAVRTGTSSAVDKNGVLKYALDLPNAFGDNFDPGTEVNDCSYAVTSLIFDTLVADGSNTKVSPGAAASWDVDPTFTTITFHLKPNLTYSDGTPVTADAVKQSLLHIKKSPLRTSLLVISNIDTPDPATVVLHLTKPVAGDLLWALTYEDGMLVAPSDLDNAADKPVGSGPFTLSSFQTGQLISLKANPKYRDAAKYKLAGVDFVQVGAGPQAVTALKSGQVDMINLRPEDYPAVKADPNLGISTTPSLDYTTMQLRETEPPFNNAQVRAALEFAVDRNEINKVVYNGQNEIASQPFPKFAAGYDKSIAKTYKYDPKKAKQMLTAAGFPNGVSFDMVIPSGEPTFERMAPLLQNEMQRAGFTAKIDRVLGGDFFTDVYVKKQGQGVLSLALTNGPALWSNFQSNYTPVGFTANAFGSVNQQMTDLVAQANKSLDPKVAGPPMQQASGLVMSQGLEVPLVFEKAMVAYDKSKVGGPPKAPIGTCRSDLAGVYIKK
jgi:peptide/nickel transport system substrate-binding protein